MTENIDEIVKRIESLEEENLELKTEKIKRKREKDSFHLVFLFYIIPLILVVFGTLSYKYPTMLKENLISSIYVILVFYLLLDSEFGKSLLKFTLVYHFIFKHEEEEGKHWIIFFTLIVSLGVLMFVFKRYLDQFDEIFNLILLVFSFLLLFLIDAIMSYIVYEHAGLIIPKKIREKIINFWRKRNEKSKILIRLIPITIIASFLVSLVLWFI